MEIIKLLLPKHLTIINFFPGHIAKMGKNAGTEYNQYCSVKSFKPDDIEKEFFVMLCNPNTLTYFSKESYDKIIVKNSNITWFENLGLIQSSNKNYPYFHQLVMSEQNTEKNPIIHINGDKFDNRISNLKISNFSEINKNIGKKARSKNAVELPKELNEYPLPKYVTYRKENLSSGSIKEYFVLDCPNKLEKRINSTKSMKVSIVDKYNEILKIMKEKNIDIIF
jgi:hypothetical protein